MDKDKLSAARIHLLKPAPNGILPPGPSADNGRNLLMAAQELFLPGVIRQDEDDLVDPGVGSQAFDAPIKDGLAPEQSKLFG
jgi:hypothetical protein